MSTTNNDSNNPNGDKKRVSTPSIGEAVKEAIETGKEVTMQGPTDTEDFDDIKDIISNTAQLNDSSSKDLDKSIELSVDEDNDSRLEINLKEPLQESKSVEDKIVVNMQKEEEATVETVTTIPTEEGIDVEVKTEVEVPVEDENKNVDSDLKVVVHSSESTTEVPIEPSTVTSSSSSPSSPQFQSSRQSLQGDQSPSFEQQESVKTNNMFNELETKYTQKNKPPSNTDDYDQPNAAAVSSISSNLYDNLRVPGQMFTLATKDMADRYIEFQNQSLYSFQSALSKFAENTGNMFWNSQAYCTNLQDMYSKMALLYTENTVALTKMFNDIAVASADTFKSFFNVSKTQ
ncbi:MAG TPA: hypothetical protein VFX18_05910 [Candidatus Nitrosocosmicus sp.]|nr:hypothetical protein [Candidatus Nitrosocosmicus sp.]